MTQERVVYRGTVEYVSAVVTADDVILNDQPVEMSFDDRETWKTAEWVGTPGSTRSCRVLANDDDIPRRRETPVFVRITDNPEVPVILAGTLFIE